MVMILVQYKAKAANDRHVDVAAGTGRFRSRPGRFWSASWVGLVIALKLPLRISSVSCATAAGE
jgi:hypothetical protein